MSKLPLYKITIDPEYSEDGQELGIEMIAFTADPAIRVKGMAFNSNIKKSSFTDNVKMRIAAPALIPMDIYRSDEDGEYFVQFTIEEIESIHGKFMKDLNNANLFNLEHNKEQVVPAYILEAWIVEDPETDKSFQTFNTKVPKGSLFVVSQITDKEYYNNLVENNQIGYSIEGFLGLKLSEIKNKKQNMSLPEGAIFEIEGKSYIIKDGQVVENTEAKMANELPTELPVEDVKKEELAVAEAPVEDAKPIIEEELACEPMKEELADVVAPTEAESPAIDEAQIMSILQPKLDEIYQMIADLKSADLEEDKVEVPVADMKMSAHQMFINLNKFVNKKK